MFTEKDLLQMNAMGIQPDTIEKQITAFKKGFPFINLARPAIPGDGIMVLSKDEIDNYVKTYETGSKSEQIVKFVPASGAASRMFKDLYAFIDEWNGIDSPEMQQKFKSAFTVLSKINKFAFAKELKQVVKKEYAIEMDAHNSNDFKNILRGILDEKGLNYGNLPKALLQFHTYPDASRTSLEEHLAEGAMYAKTNKNEVNIHFTVTPEHLPLFKKKLAVVQATYEKQYGITFQITYSIQKPSTDTIAVTLDNEPFRTNDGKLLFRPGGHGALIENLNELDASLVFIKNIDNVVPDHLKPQTVLFKKAIGGLLLELKNQIFTFLQKIEKGEKQNELKNEIILFYKKYFHITFESAISIEKIYTFLNRPIRVCGMVKNEGEPGGGPYWIVANNNTSLQVIESSQVNNGDENQMNTFKNATHFNPVDLVCYVKDFRGKKFNLYDFIDPNTGFISKKSKDGIDLKALELPGLWNGAMSDWNTIFVEVPLITFNPVKTINDLLRNEHQTA